MLSDYLSEVPENAFQSKINYKTEMKRISILISIKLIPTCVKRNSTLI